MFVGREREQRLLSKEIERQRPSLVVVTGRRRVGKSRLLREATAKHRTVIFQATRLSSELNLEGFKQEVANVLGASEVLNGITTWEGVLNYAGQFASEEQPLVVVIDEFPYLSDTYAPLPSILQRFWDQEVARDGRLNLILCGSAISQMEELLAERNPLYGRATMKLTIRPLPLRDAALFFPHYSGEEQILAHAIFGGTPYYLRLCDPSADLKSNVIDLLLTEGAPLIDEPNTLLQSELRDPAVYSSILFAIATGCNTANEIANRIGRDSTGAITPYLEKLRALDLIRATKSLDANEKARNFRFHINDRLIAFWHWFVRPNLTAISEGQGLDVYDERVAPYLSEYMGKAFEGLCVDHVQQHGKELFGSAAQEIGQIWSGDYDIDVAGTLLDGSVFFGECKWQSEPIGGGVVRTLLERAETTAYGRRAPSRHFILFSRNGFTSEASRMAEDNGSMVLLSPSDMPFAPVPAATPTLG